MRNSRLWIRNGLNASVVWKRSLFQSLLKGHNRLFKPSRCQLKLLQPVQLRFLNPFFNLNLPTKLQAGLDCLPTRLLYPKMTNFRVQIFTNQPTELPLIRHRLPLINRVASRMRFLRYLALICFCSRISSKHAGTRL